MLPPSPPGSNHLVHNVLTFFHSQSSSIKVICNSIIPFAHTPPWIPSHLTTPNPTKPSMESSYTYLHSFTVFFFFKIRLSQLFINQGDMQWYTTFCTQTLLDMQIPS